MKKAFIIVTLFVFIVSVVSAGAIYFDTGVSFSNGSRKFVFEDSSSEGVEPIPVSVMSLPLEVGYMHTFDNDIVVSASVSPFITLSEKLNGDSLEENYFPICTAIKAQVGYSINVNKEMDAEFLGGFSYAIGSRKKSIAKNSYKTLSLVGEAGIKYEIDSSFYLRAGAKIAFPFTTNIRTTIESGSVTDYTDTKFKGFMFSFTPFIGGAYQF